MIACTAGSQCDVNSTTEQRLIERLQQPGRVLFARVAVQTTRVIGNRVNEQVT